MEDLVDENDGRLALLAIIWEALEEYREVAGVDDVKWDNICAAMAWIQEDIEREM